LAEIPFSNSVLKGLPMYPRFIPSSDNDTESLGLADRRRTGRFPFQEDLTYKSTKGKVTTAGAGKTLNISSGGGMFTTEQPLVMGRTVEISINWPVRLEDGCLLRFIASGPVIRSEADHATMLINRYEFRTRSSRTIQSADDREIIRIDQYEFRNADRGRISA
jgi:hypothetical protein